MPNWIRASNSRVAGLFAVVLAGLLSGCCSGSVAVRFEREREINASGQPLDIHLWCVMPKNAKQNPNLDPKKGLVPTKTYFANPDTALTGVPLGQRKTIQLPGRTPEANPAPVTVAMTHEHEWFEDANATLWIFADFRDSANRVRDDVEPIRVGVHGKKTVVVFVGREGLRLQSVD
ncbi:MAG: hypothetical protein AB7Q17_14525 [Phycisphaerae bacterium]